MALDDERWLGLDVEQATHMAVGGVGDAQAAGRRRALHPRGQVDRRASCGVLALDTSAENDCRCVDSDTYGEATEAPARLDLSRVSPRLVEEHESSTHSPLCVVFVGSRGTEDRLEAIAHKAQH